LIFFDKNLFLRRALRIGASLRGLTPINKQLSASSIFAIEVLNKNSNAEQIQNQQLVVTLQKLD
jgi:hypothetical protein